MKLKKPLLFEDYTLPPPDSSAKAACLQAVRSRARTPVRRLGLGSQLAIQAQYLGAAFWMAVGFILCAFLLCFFYLYHYSYINTQQDAAVLLAFTGPAFSMVLVPLINKSFTYGMWELEESALHSLPRLTMLRLLLAFFICLPLLMLVVCLGAGFIGLWQTLYSLLLPLLLACLANFIILGYLRGMAGSILCLAVDFLMAFTVILGINIANTLLPISPTALLCLLTAALLGCIAAARHMITKPVPEGRLN